MKTTEEMYEASLAAEKEELHAHLRQIQRKRWAEHEAHLRTQLAGMAGIGQTSNGLDQSNASAPKPWVELSIEEKIERIRQQVKQTQEQLGHFHRTVDDLRRSSRQAARDLVEHRHALDDAGKVMLPAGSREKDEPYGAGCCEKLAPPVDPSKVYF